MGFRALEVQWFGESVLLLKQNLGHIVSTEEIIDLQSMQWRLQRTVS